MKITIELNESDIDEIMELARDYYDLVSELNGLRRDRCSNQATEDTD